MVVHELAVNARKYGSLSVPHGQLYVSWSVLGLEPALELQWAESGGPLVAMPQKRGFGSVLIGRSLDGVGGGSEMNFAPSGLVCILRVPLAANTGDHLAQEQGQ